MSSLGDEFRSNSEQLRRAESTQHYTIWGTLLIVCAIVLLGFGESLFTGRNAFLTFLGGFFALVAAIAYGRNYVLSMEVARKQGDQGLQSSSRRILFMGVISALICIVCLISLIVS